MLLQAALSTGSGVPAAFESPVVMDAISLKDSRTLYAPSARLQ